MDVPFIEDAVIEMGEKPSLLLEADLGRGMTPRYFPSGANSMNARVARNDHARGRCL
jgi:hypothetical protein